MTDYAAKHNYYLKDYIRERGEPNDPDLDSEKVLLFLAQGKRIPQNDYEKKLLAEIEEIKAAGKELEIPSNML
jgi:hypothetical protein